MSIVEDGVDAQRKRRTLLHPLIQRLNESRIYPHVTPRAYQESVPTGFLIGRCSSRAGDGELESPARALRGREFPWFCVAARTLWRFASFSATPRSYSSATSEACMPKVSLGATVRKNWSCYWVLNGC
jgi:hypothetical protein